MLLLILIPVGIYLLIGMVLSLSIDFEDLRRRRVSVPGALRMGSSAHPIISIVFFALWPAWYFSYRDSVKKGRPEVLIAYGEDAPDYADETKLIPETEESDMPIVEELKSSYGDSPEGRKLAELARLARESKSSNPPSQPTTGQASRRG